MREDTSTDVLMKVVGQVQGVLSGLSPAPTPSGKGLISEPSPTASLHSGLDQAENPEEIGSS